MIGRTLFSIALAVLAASSTTSAFTPSASSAAVRSNNGALKMGAESEVSFSNLDGSNIRIGVLRTRWNDEHVSNLVSGIEAGLKECNVPADNIFIKEVPGAYELPYAAKLLAMSGTVDAIICTGVLIKGDTLHFEYISDAVSSGIMGVSLQTMCPVVYGVLNCLDEEQVRKRSSGDNNHGVDWGKTAVEMAVMKKEASGKAGDKPKVDAKLSAMGFGSADPEKTDAKAGEKKSPGFF